MNREKIVLLLQAIVDDMFQFVMLLPASELVQPTVDKCNMIVKELYKDEIMFEKLRDKYQPMQKIDTKELYKESAKKLESLPKANIKFEEVEGDGLNIKGVKKMTQNIERK